MFTWQACGLIASTAVGLMPEQDEDTTEWINILRTLPSFGAIQDRLGETLRKALAVETDATLVTEYLIQMRENLKVCCHAAVHACKHRRRCALKCS